MSHIDEYSYNLGLHVGEIKAWCEAAGNDAKKMSLSAPFKPEELRSIEPYMKKYAEKNHVSYILEEELIQTDLFGDMGLSGIWVFFIYKHPEVIEEYHSLKRERQKLIEDDAYTGEPRRSIAVRFGRLLGYSDEAIERRWR